jgi:hypothetical protein
LQYETPTGDASAIARKYRVLLMRLDSFEENSFDGKGYPNGTFKYWAKTEAGLCKACNAECGTGHCFFCYGQVRRILL